MDLRKLGRQSNLDIAKDHNIMFTKISQFIQLTKGILQDSIIKNEHTYSYITKATCTFVQTDILERYIKSNQQQFSPENFNLFKIYLHMTGKTLLKGFFVSIISETMTAFGIFILDLITESLKVYEGDQGNKIKLTGLMLGLVLNFTVRNLMTCQQQWIKYKWQAQCKNTLQYLVYKKSLLVKNYSKQNTSKQSQENKEQSKGMEPLKIEQVEDNDTTFEKKNPDINNLLTVDIEESTQMFWGINRLASSLSMLFITISIIYYKVGDTVFGGLYILSFPCIFNIIISYFIKLFEPSIPYTIIFKQKSLEQMWIAKDERISLSKDVIEGMKSIKYLGWESIFLNKINLLRRKEYSYVFRARFLDGFLTIFFSSLTYILSYCFITQFVSSGNELTDSNVFTIMALFSYLTWPLGVAPQAIKSILKARISFKRIQHFLNMKEIDSNESKILLKLNKFILSLLIKKAISTDQIFKEKRNVSQNINEYSQVAIKLKNTKFNWPNKEISVQRDLDYEQNEQSQNQEYISIKQTQNEQYFQLNVDDVEIKKGSLSFVIGKIGSGKSAFLLAIMNEMERQRYLSLSENNIQSKIIVNGSIAYVAQNHWLQSKTIRENILFGEELDLNLYETCISLCELKVDLNQFSSGDQKIISSDGNNLSGGQRQRIALCRSLYAQRDIYILDDIFSSLDAQIAYKIFQNVIIDYLIREKQKTVIFATSHYSYLQVYKQSNIIYIMDGIIINDEGQKNEYIQQSIHQEEQIENEIKSYLNTNKIFEQTKIIPTNLKQEMSKNNETDLKQQYLDSKSIDIDLNENFILLKDNDKSTKPLSTEMEIMIPKQKNEIQFIKLQEEKSTIDEERYGDGEEYREKGMIKMETLKDFFKSMNVILVVFEVFFFLMVQGASLVIDYWLKDQLEGEKGTQAALLRQINNLFGIFQQTFLFLTIIQVSIAATSCVIYVTTSLLSTYRVYHKLINSIMNSKMVFFDNNPVGKIINRLSDDVNSMDDSLHLQFQSSLEQIAYVLGYPIGICIQFPWMSVFFIFGFIWAKIISNSYRPINREIKRLDSINIGALLNHMNESCQGVSTIRALGKQAYMVEQYLEKLRNSINTFVLSLSLQMWMYARLLLLSNAIQLIVAITCLVLIFIESHISNEMIILTLQYSILFSSSICETTNSLCQLEQEMISFERIRQYFSNELENVNEKPLKMLRNSLNNNQDISILFQNVFMTYDDPKSIKAQYALKDFNLSIKRGEKIAFCGRTGSGKTSILNCLYRLYEIEKGNILINGENILNLSLSELRNQMSIIPQFGFLYNASLRENIDPLNEKTDQQISSIISSCEFSLSSENQQGNTADLQFGIQESGKNLSNGQKQIINFLRVALKNTDIICLDEATSNMDPKTDALIHENLFELSQGKTLLVITHRLENIERFDRVVVLDSGQIVECGSVIHLKSIEGGFFNQLLTQKNIQNQ